MAGPTQTEAEAGLTTPFVTDVLNGVVLGSDGNARIDLSTRIRSIPSVFIFTSDGPGGAALAQLKATAMQFATVQALTFSIDGSQEAWCDLTDGGDCGTLTRLDIEQK